MHAGTIRHELHEVQSIKKGLNPKMPIPSSAASQINAYLGKPTNHPTGKESVRKALGLKLTSIERNGQQTGSHADLSVLARDSHVLRTNPHMRTQKAFRKETGESQLLHKITGKIMGVDKFNHKDFRKLERSDPGTNSIYSHKVYKVHD